MKVHEEMPDTPLILNTGVFPFITHQEKADGSKVNPVGNKILTTLAKGLAKLGRCPKGDDWWTIGVKNLGHVVVCGPQGVADFFKNAGELKKSKAGHQFAMTDIPPDLVEVLQEQREEGEEYAGVSVAGNAMLDYFAKKVPFLRSWSEKTISYYYEFIGNKLKSTPQVQLIGKHTIGVESATKKQRVEHQVEYLEDDIGRRGVKPIVYSGDPVAVSRVALERKKNK
jgi:hypothetical protein